MIIYSTNIHDIPHVERFVGYNTMLGYRYVDGVLSVVPEEVVVVQLIFQLYLEGLGFA